MSAEYLRHEAAAKDRLAEQLQREAATLPALLDGVAARFGPDVWRGPAADDFGTQLRRWRNRLDAEADTLLAVAHRLRLRADEMRGEAARIEAAERAAEVERQAALRRAAERRDAA